MNSTNILDAKGLACPMPIVRTKKAINALETGEVLEVHVTDKGATVDFPAWANASGHEILEQTDDAGILKILIKKG
ncbi:sulfurtransferase TusA family protein [Sporosarcina siberiensis]|uniref:Sulfurtransferase TusA family protein n=1 Tax=Sporosarcina siberiensis TaxID=1365606 RepID=A0ABW4SGW3_9BACL